MEGLKARDGRSATIIGVFIFRNEDQGCSTGTFDRQGRGETLLPLESRDKKFDREAAVPTVRKEAGDPRIRPAHAPRRSSAKRNVQRGGVVRVLAVDKTDCEISVGPVHCSAMLVAAGRASDLAARSTEKRWREWAAGLLAVRDAVTALPPLPIAGWVAGTLLLRLVAGLRAVRFRRLLARALPTPGSVTRMVEAACQEMRLHRVPETLMVDARLSP